MKQIEEFRLPSLIKKNLKSPVFPSFPMANIVYVHAYVRDRQVVRELGRFYTQIRDSGIEGLERIQPVLGKRKLDELVAEQPERFRDAINQYPFEGLGIWTEWLDGSKIDEFYRSQLHQEFSQYAQGTLDRAWYRVIQLRGDNISTIEVR